MRENSTVVVCADDGVGFPVADAALFGEDGRTLIDIHAVWDKTATGRFSLAFIVLLAAVTQVEIKYSAVFLVAPDMLIDALVADESLSLLFQPAADLIGAPLFQRQLFLDQGHQCGLHFARLGTGGPAPHRGLLVCLFEAVASGAGVALELVG